MPELTVVVRVPLPKQSTLAALEVSIFRAPMAAGRDLLTQAFGVLEQGVLTGARQRRRRRYLITRFGEIQFFRWQVRTEQGYRYPLDQALGLRATDPCSAWVRATAAWLAQAYPFRQAARLLGRMIGCPVDHRRLWGWTQASGRKLRAHFEERRAALFDHGEIPAFLGEPHRIVSTSADGTFIRSRDGPIEVKVGAVVDGCPPPQRHRGPPPVPAPGQGVLRHHPRRRLLRPDLLRPGRGPGRHRRGPGRCSSSPTGRGG